VPADQLASHLTGTRSSQLLKETALAQTSIESLLEVALAGSLAAQAQEVWNGT